VVSFHAKATANQAARWKHWARLAGFHAVGPWLEMLANREVKRQEIAGGYRDPLDESITDARMKLCQTSQAKTDGPNGHETPTS
jgi:hypothetical protein